MENYVIYETEIGLISIGYVDDSIVYFKKVDAVSISGSKKNELTDRAYSQLVEYLNGERKIFDFKYSLRGTEFQKKVWKELCNIPYGETRTYKEIAISIGKPNVYRAVGLANNKNPVTIVVPCHRVVGSSGELVGYAGGLDMKKKLLSLEKKHK